MKNKMKRVISWVKSHLWLFKLIFITSVMFFVVNQLTNILHGMTWEKFISLVFRQGLGSIFLMMIVGLLCVLPMILYDVATVKTLQLDLPIKTIGIDGWVINTINNLVGFGGVVGVTLRMNRYGKEKKGAQTLATITKTALFMLTGLSLLCFVMVLFLNFSDIATVYQHYQLWLCIGSCFAPCLLLFIYWKKDLFKEFKKRQIALFYTASFGQWLGAMVIFLFIGHQLVPSLMIIKVAPLFVAATLIGMITMVPGGIGTFDVLMILGLASVGIEKEVAVVWLLFYRLFYYVLPFISGCLIFIHQTGNKVDHALNHLPSMMTHKVLHYIATILLYINGILMIVLVTMPKLSIFSRFFNWLFPFPVTLINQSITMMVGLLLIGLARGVYQHVKRSYNITFIVLALCLCNSLFISHNRLFSVLLIITLLCLFLSRKEFTREGMVYSWGSLVLDFMIFLGITIFYGLIGYFVNTHHQFSSTNFILFPSETIWFRGLLGLLAAAMILVVLYYYLSRDAHIGEVFDEQRFMELLQRYPDKWNHHLGFMGTYRCYYYKKHDKDKICFLFRKVANHCIVLGNPIGDKEYIKEAVESFKQELARYNYQAVFYNIDHHFSVLLHDFGYEFMKIGEEGYHDDDGHLDHPSSQTTWLTEDKKMDVFEQCQALSDDFQALHHPLYFNRASFNPCLFKHSEIMTYMVDGELIAYALLSPVHQQTIDLMYIHYSDPNSVKPFIYDIQSLCEEKQLSLSLGMSPLYNVGTSRFAFMEEKLINVVYHFGETASQLEKMTAAMSPYVNRWENRYVSYLRHQSFSTLLLQVVLLMFKKPKSMK